MKKLLQGLETALLINRIEMKPEIKKGCIPNFLKVVKEPFEIKAFKGKLHVTERAHFVLPAKTRLFNTDELITHQKEVIKKNLQYFLQRPSLTASAIQHKHYGMIEPIVVHCATGLHVYDGNHRANINHLRGKKHKAKYVDLRWIKPDMTRADLKAAAKKKSKSR